MRLPRRPWRARTTPPTITCEVARQAISALSDDEEPPVGVSAVRTHLHDCPTCQAFEQALTSSTSGFPPLLRSPRPVPSHLIEILHHELSPSEPAGALRGSGRRPGVGTSGARVAGILRWSALASSVVAAAVFVSTGFAEPYHPHPAHGSTMCSPRDLHWTFKH